MSSGARIERGARLVSAGILISRVVGFVRNWLFARYFGDSMAADAYGAASKIPNIVRNLLGEGTISASFIPVYAAALERDPRGARALANALLGVLLLLVSGLTLVGVLAAPWLTQVFASGLSSETAALTTRLLRVLFPMTGVMVLSAWCLGVQNAHRRFFLAYASAAMWSLTQIALLLVAGPGESDLVRLVWYLSWATLVGAVVQVATQVPQVMRLVGGIRPTVAGAPRELAVVVRNFGPVVAALGLFQISGLVDLQIASWLPDGAIASLNYANQLYLLPFALFGIATAAAALPEFARDGVGHGAAAVADGAVRAIARAAFYTVPSAVTFIVLGDVIVGLLYRSGEFGAQEQRVVHVVLAAYAMGLVGYSTSRILAASFHALQDYRAPMRAAGVAVGVSGLAAVALSLPFRTSVYATAGIALGSALGAYCNVTLLWRGLRHRTGGTLSASRIAMSLLLSAKWSVIAALVAASARFGLRAWPVQLTALLTLPLFAGVYLWGARRDGSDEATKLWDGMVRRLGHDGAARSDGT